jgi:hypothetical protein
VCPSGAILTEGTTVGAQQKVFEQICSTAFIKTHRFRKARNKRPANEVSAQEIDGVFDAIRKHDGYPKLKELAKLVPSLSPAQVNAAVRYLERSSAIVIDDQGYIIWTRGESKSLSFSDIANMSRGFSEYVKRIEP